MQGDTFWKTIAHKGNYFFFVGFTIVRVYKSTPNITKCIEVTSPSHVKYAMKVDSINSIIFEVSRSQNNIRNIIIVVDKRCNEGVVHSFMPLLNNEQQYFNLYPHTLSETIVTSYRSFPREMDLNCFAFFIMGLKLEKIFPN